MERGIGSLKCIIPLQCACRMSAHSGPLHPARQMSAVLGVIGLGPVNASRRRPVSALVTAMAGFDDPAFYGDRWAAVYDDHHKQVDPGPAVEFLAGLAGDGRVLELAIGTGRVAPAAGGPGDQCGRG
jgi:hypothetical protein